MRTRLLPSLLALSNWACSAPAAFEDSGTDDTLGTSQESVVSGSTSGVDTRVVQVKRVGAENTGLCTGTLLRSNIVLTARHCVGSADGVWRRHYIVTSTGQTVEVTHPSSKVIEHPDVDLALVKLDQHVSIPARGNLDYWTPLYEGNPSGLVGASANCQGYGRNVCSGGGAGTLKRASLTVNEATESSIEYLPNDSGQILAKGDSGGPCFAGGNSEQIGVTRTVGDDCTFARQTPVSVHFPWIRQQLGQMQAAVFYEFTSPAHLYAFEFIDLPGSSAAPSQWGIDPSPPLGGGHSLVQNSNINGPGTVAALKGNVLSDAYVETVVRSNDDDSASIVLRYANIANYYRVSAWGSGSDVSGIYKVKGGVTTLLGSCTARLDAETFLSANILDDTITAVIDGSSRCTITVTDHDLRDGRVGIMTNGLQGAAFEYFTARSSH